MSAECSGWVYKYSPAKHGTLLVHLALADAANDMHGYEIWMRQGVLAEKCRVTRQTVNTALAWLVEEDLLEVLEQGKGRHKANRYRFLMPIALPVFDPPGSVKRADTSRGKVSNQPTPSVKPADTLGPESVKPLDTEPKRDITQTEPKLNDARATFDQFWDTYPRKAGKGQARKAWTTATAIADPSVVIAGATTYAADPNRVDEFTAHPATWLNGERWEDDPLPSRGSNGNAPQIDTDRDGPSGVVDWSEV